MELQDRVAVITGGGGGIGRGIALELAKNRASVVGAYVSDKESADRARAEIGGEGVDVEMVRCDVSNEKEVKALSDTVMQKHGRVDFLVNNAGIHQHLKSWELSAEDWRRVIDVNLTGVFLVTKAFTPAMKEQGFGRVVNISSCIAYTGTDHEVHYAASKGGVAALTKSLALELAGCGINVNTIAPGYVSTDMCVFDSEEEERKALETIPKGRLGLPDDIAKSVSFLCSEGADYITGQVIHVNGGLLMY